MTPKETYRMIRKYGMTETGNKAYVKKYQDVLRDLTTSVAHARTKLEALRKKNGR